MEPRRTPARTRHEDFRSFVEIEPPLPLLNKSFREQNIQQEAFGFLKLLPQFKISSEVQTLSQINGPPIDQFFYEE